MWPVGLIHTLGKKEEREKKFRRSRERVWWDEGDERVETGKWIF